MGDPSSDRADRRAWKDLMKASEKEAWGKDAQRAASHRGGIRQDQEHAARARAYLREDK